MADNLRKRIASTEVAERVAKRRGLAQSSDPALDPKVRDVLDPLIERVSELTGESNAAPLNAAVTLQDLKNIGFAVVNGKLVGIGNAAD